MSKCQRKKLRDDEDPRRLELSAMPSLKDFIPYNKGSSVMKLQPRNDLALVGFTCIGNVFHILCKRKTVQ
jgi:hypothetical protein